MSSSHVLIRCKGQMTKCWYVISLDCMTTGTIIIIHFEFNQKVFCLLVFPLLKCFRVADFFFQLIPKEEWKNNWVGMLSEDAPNLQNIIACVVYSCSAVLYLVMMCVKLIIDVLSLVFSTCFF